MNAQTLSIDIISDVVCPWCFIGKRHLEAALALAREAGLPEPIVRWHAFQLNPHLPQEGVPRKEYLEAKFGGPERAAEIYARVAAAASQAGLAVNFEGIERQPNTLPAHALIMFAQRQGAGDAVVEALFRAYFMEGRFIGNRDVLMEIAAACGLDKDAAGAALDDPAIQQEVAAADSRAREIGISGVPFFIFNQRVGASGAQPAEVLLDAMKQALAEAAP